MRISDWSSDACSSNLLDPKITASRPLELCAYGIGRSDDELPNTHVGILKALKDWGLPISRELKLAKGVAECRAYYQAIGEKRDAKIGRASCRERGWQYV